MNTDTQLESIINDIRMRRTSVIRGLTALRDLKEVLNHAMSALGVQVTWDPSSDPSLVDVLGGVTIGALQGALAGAGLGLLIGLLVGDVESGMALGAMVGTAGGAVRGAHKVAEGWRVRLWHDEAGTPMASVTVTR